MGRQEVLIVMAAHWPRALLQAELTEAGYEVVGAPTLAAALAYAAQGGGRRPVALIILDHLVDDVRDGSLLRDLLARHPAAQVLQLQSALHRRGTVDGACVLRHPVSIAEIVRTTESLLAPPPTSVQPIDRISKALQRRSHTATQEQEVIMAGKVNPIPQGYHSITPSLAVREADRAIDFYKRALGADEMFRMPGPDGKIIHAELRIGNSMIMLSEERLEMDVKSPKTLGGTPVGFYVYVENVDSAWKRAVDAGASTVMPLADMFWGDRTGCVEDPFGHRWWLSQHIADLTPEEIQKGQEAFFAQAQSAP